MRSLSCCLSISCFPPDIFSLYADRDLATGDPISTYLTARMDAWILRTNWREMHDELDTDGLLLARSIAGRRLLPN